MARALAIVAVMAMAVFGMASAATYNVGEPGGSWDLRTNYTDWVASKRFHPGDKIGKHLHLLLTSSFIIHAYTHNIVDRLI
ncbi:hypothetical protein PR202_gb15973 [Eleusine coracana subsp. coracana]|uniref:Phytocyanin domain-containing protein n=1 Tax=Eleusine coracana subsp. coracana TaxID=191504 RepID=A0AAV5EWY3_ELECO|nr:hypothetical protein PR202_gb15973 [Eleusine coracana subsp. coracana]